MRGVVGEINEERLIGIRLRADVIGGAIVEGIGDVEVIRQFLHRRFAIDQREGIEVIHHTPDRAVERLKSTARGVLLDRREEIGEALAIEIKHVFGTLKRVGDVPLAEHRGVIARGFENLSDRRRGRLESTAVTRQWRLLGHCANASLMRIKTGEQRRASGAAASIVEKAGEAHAVSCQRIEIGGVRFPAETTGVGISHIISEDDKDVGTGGRCRDRLRRGGDEYQGREKRKAWQSHLATVQSCSVSGSEPLIEKKITICQ